MALQRVREPLRWPPQQWLLIHDPSTFHFRPCDPRPHCSNSMLSAKSGCNQYLAMIVRFAKFLEHRRRLIEADRSCYKTIHRHSARFEHALNKSEVARNISKCESHAQSLQSRRDNSKVFGLHARAHQYQLRISWRHLDQLHDDRTANALEDHRGLAAGLPLEFCDRIGMLPR